MTHLVGTDVGHVEVACRAGGARSDRRPGLSVVVEEVGLHHVVRAVDPRPGRGENVLWNQVSPTDGARPVLCWSGLRTVSGEAEAGAGMVPGALRRAQSRVGTHPARHGAFVHVQRDRARERERRRVAGLAVVIRAVHRAAARRTWPPTLGVEDVDVQPEAVPYRLTMDWNDGDPTVVCRRDGTRQHQPDKSRQRESDENTHAPRHSDPPASPESSHRTPELTPCRGPALARPGLPFMPRRGREADDVAGPPGQRPPFGPGPVLTNGHRSAVVQMPPDYEALSTSANNSRAWRLFSTVATSSGRLWRTTSVRAYLNSSWLPSHHSASAPIASSARPG